MSLNGVEKIFTEPNLAGMLDMRKGPLYEMLGQATQQQLAQPRTNFSTRPSGRAAPLMAKAPPSWEETPTAPSR